MAARPTDPRILVVDDEFLVLWMLKDTLNDMGYKAVSTAGDAKSGLNAVRSEPIDFAILDVNLGGDRSFAIAEELEARHVPFVFVTGYGRRGLDGRFASTEVLDKPIRPDQLKKALERINSRDR